MKKIKSLLLMLALAMILGMTGCSEVASSRDSQETANQIEEKGTKDSESVDQEEPVAETTKEVSTEAKDKVESGASDSKINKEMAQVIQELGDIPEYAGKAYIAINNNVPFFSEQDMSNTSSFEIYSDLDGENRCGVAYANVGIDIMPTTERGSIGSIKPTGWHTIKYDNISGKYLYNRCHLIGFQLAGENANEKNLITGTRYLNIDGMLPFENMVTDYVKETNNHVLYRVTPIFQGLNLLASGVMMEGYSVEDGGEGIEFCVYAYDVQPGINITYATGDNASVVAVAPVKVAAPVSEPAESQAETREELIAQGYEPCKNCNP